MSTHGLRDTCLYEENRFRKMEPHEGLHGALSNDLFIKSTYKTMTYLFSVEK